MCPLAVIYSVTTVSVQTVLHHCLGNYVSQMTAAFDHKSLLTNASWFLNYSVWLLNNKQPNQKLSCTLPMWFQGQPLFTVCSWEPFLAILQGSYQCENKWRRHRSLCAVIISLQMSQNGLNSFIIRSSMEMNTCKWMARRKRGEHFSSVPDF